MGDVKALISISNLVEDISVLPEDVKNLKFMYSNKFVNWLGDRIAKKSHPLTSQIVFH